MAPPVASSDAVNKGFVVDNFYSNLTTLDDILDPISNINMNSHRIVSLANPVDAQDAATKQYVDTEIGAIQQDRIVNATNVNSKIVANTTEITNGTTPLNMNS